jgi:hypothetical protein
LGNSAHKTVIRAQAGLVKTNLDAPRSGKVAVMRLFFPFGATPLGCFADFFDTDLDLLTTWSELEHFVYLFGAKFNNDPSIGRTT